MPIFKDNTGREWSIALDAPTIRSIRKEFDNLDLVAVDGSAVEKLIDDPVLLVDVLWVLCREQARAASVDEVQFAKGLCGDAIACATQALVDAVADFFPKSKRELLLAVTNKNSTLREAAMKMALDRVNDPEIEKRLLAKVEEQLDRSMQFKSATNSPVTSE